MNSKVSSILLLILANGVIVSWLIFANKQAVEHAVQPEVQRLMEPEVQRLVTQDVPQVLTQSFREASELDGMFARQLRENGLRSLRELVERLEYLEEELEDLVGQ